jgi:hypothetical protein
MVYNWCAHVTVGRWNESLRHLGVGLIDTHTDIRTLPHFPDEHNGSRFSVPADAKVGLHLIYASVSQSDSASVSPSVNKFRVAYLIINHTFCIGAKRDDGAGNNTAAGCSWRDILLPGSAMP